MSCPSCRSGVDFILTGTVCRCRCGELVSHAATTFFVPQLEGAMMAVRSDGSLWMSSRNSRDTVPEGERESAVSGALALVSARQVLES